MSKEAMKLALVALEVATTPFARDRQEVLRAQAALREALAEQPAQQEPVAASKKDAVFAASIEFIGTLTGMQPPPIEVAPAEIFKPFRDFTEKVCLIFATSPPASKPWVGLPESAFAAMTLQQVSAMKYAELVLKEKNNG